VIHERLREAPWWDFVDEVAKGLLARQQLTYDDFKEIARRHDVEPR
jgi:hypothetical protein